MRKILSTVSLLAACLSCLSFMAAAPDDKSPKPRYDDKGQLVRPADYREWMFLSAGFGMNYSPEPDGHEMFTNVFVQRWAYDEFANSGKWPEQTMFVIDERDAASRSSINQKGHYQTDLMGLAVEVKDSAKQSRQVGLLRLQRRQPGCRGQGRRSDAERQRLLVLPRRPRRGRAYVRAVLSHAESRGEKIWHLQRSARAGNRREVDFARVVPSVGRALLPAIAGSAQLLP